jgi:hypothetical protein
MQVKNLVTFCGSHEFVRSFLRILSSSIRGIGGIAPGQGLSLRTSPLYQVIYCQLILTKFLRGRFAVLSGRAVVDDRLLRFPVSSTHLIKNRGKRPDGVTGALSVVRSQ